MPVQNEAERKVLRQILSAAGWQPHIRGARRQDALFVDIDKYRFILAGNTAKARKRAENGAKNPPYPTVADAWMNAESFVDRSREFADWIITIIGNGPHEPREERTALLTVRVRPSELDELHRRALDEGLSTSEWVRSRLLGDPA